MPSRSRLRIGTRGSRLARWQAEWVGRQLHQAGIDTELVFITTSGDRHQHWGVQSLGTVGVFTKEIQLALLAEEIDLAVHSLKDLPTQQPEGLVIAAIPPRGSVADLLLSRGGKTLFELPVGATIGTGSRRRAAQLLFHRRDLAVIPIRGNLDTRLRKLDEGQFDAIVVAEAGLVRLGETSRNGQILTPRFLLPAPGQGALAIEVRADDHQTLSQVRFLHDGKTAGEVTAERAVLACLDAGCLAPVAAWGRVVQNRLLLTARVLTPDGSLKLEVTCAGEPSRAKALGERVAELLQRQGADKLIASVRSSQGRPS